MRLRLDAPWKELVENAREAANGVICFGASSCADIFVNKLQQKFNIQYVVDNDSKKWGTKLFGSMDVYSPEKLKEAGTQDILVITSTYYDEIIAQLTQMDFAGTVYSFLHLREKVAKEEQLRDFEENMEKLCTLMADEKSKRIIRTVYEKRKNNIKDYSDICEERQYFVEGIMEPCKDEVFIDGGCFDGGTVRQAIDFFGGKFKKIYSFEMDKTNYDRIDKAAFDDRVEFLNYGLWDCAQTVSFVENSAGSEITEDGGSVAYCIALDELIHEKITFIKMDIEGAEQKALQGAKKHIVNDRPKLAICLYHKFADIWEIPLMLHALVPEYKMYIRHHGKNSEETVLYAHI